MGSSRVPFEALKGSCKGTLGLNRKPTLLNLHVQGSIIRMGCWGIAYYIYGKEPQKT